MRGSLRLLRAAEARKARNLTREEFEELKYDIIRNRGRGNAPKTMMLLVGAALFSYGFTVWKIQQSRPGDLRDMEPLPPSESAILDEVEKAKLAESDAQPASPSQ